MEDAKSFNFFDWIKGVTKEEKGFIDTSKKVDLSLDSHEEEN